jgi:hypothetical protein
MITEIVKVNVSSCQRVTLTLSSQMITPTVKDTSIIHAGDHLDNKNMEIIIWLDKNTYVFPRLSSG